MAEEMSQSTEAGAEYTPVLKEIDIEEAMAIIDEMKVPRIEDSSQLSALVKEANSQARALKNSGKDGDAKLLFRSAIGFVQQHDTRFAGFARKDRLDNATLEEAKKTMSNLGLTEADVSDEELKEIVRLANDRAKQENAATDAAGDVALYLGDIGVQKRAAQLIEN